MFEIFPLSLCFLQFNSILVGLGLAKVFPSLAKTIKEVGSLFNFHDINLLASKHTSVVLSLWSDHERLS